MIMERDINHLILSDGVHICLQTPCCSWVQCWFVVYMIKHLTLEEFTLEGSAKFLIYGELAVEIIELHVIF